MNVVFDPIFRGPFFGTLFMCVASSLIGVILFLKKKTLLSESLSHSTYPGVAGALLLFGSLFPVLDSWAFLPVIAGAFVSSFLGFRAICFLQERQKVHPDAALCFILSLFFGIGILLVSAMQTLLPLWHKYTQMFLFGQSATMTDVHILVYGGLACAIALFVWLYFYPLQATLFDRAFAESIGMKTATIERLTFWLLLVALIIGIRSVGVVLMSGMVIAPAIGARQFTNSLSKMFVLAALFGAASGLLGNVLAFTLAKSTNLSFPTGPMIVLVGGLFAFLSLLFAPQKGLVFRKWRIGRFHAKCLEENILKSLWKRGACSCGKNNFFALRRLQRQGWITIDCGTCSLTPDGKKRAAFIVRLHRLWELYLADSLKLNIEKVHKTAEEMEHILTPDLEERLTRLLNNPRTDPHHQPIPEKEARP